MASSSDSKETLFYLMFKLFGMEKPTCYCLVHGYVRGKILVKV